MARRAIGQCLFTFFHRRNRHWTISIWCTMSLATIGLLELGLFLTFPSSTLRRYTLASSSYVAHMAPATIDASSIYRAASVLCLACLNQVLGCKRRVLSPMWIRHDADAGKGALDRSMMPIDQQDATYPSKPDSPRTKLYLYACNSLDGR